MKCGFIMQFCFVFLPFVCANCQNIFFVFIFFFCLFNVVQDHILQELNRFFYLTDWWVPSNLNALWMSLSAIYHDIQNLTTVLCVLDFGCGFTLLASICLCISRLLDYCIHWLFKEGKKFFLHTNFSDSFDSANYYHIFGWNSSIDFCIGVSCHILSRSTRIIHRYIFW